MPEDALEATPVVTGFLYRRGRVLLLKRSEQVRSHRGRWAGVSGYLERPPLAQARLELWEEVGVSREDAALRGIGLPLLVEEPEKGRSWLVFTFLFRLREGVEVRRDWESAASAWVRPEELEALDTVPGLQDGLGRVWPPWGGRRFWGETEGIACDTVGGASELALRGLRAVARVRGDNRRRALLAFASLHPSMGVFPHLACRALAGPISVARLGRELEEAARESARGAARGMRDCRRVLTHSASRACREALLLWGGEGREVVVTESRPKREGVALARELAGCGLSVTLISEAEIGLFVPRTDAVVVGADGIAGGDHLINKVGTRLAVLAAREAGVPAYAVAQTHKICPSGWPLALTPQEPADIARVSGVRVANVAFDATPISWFSGVFTERGRLTRELLSKTRGALAGGRRRMLAWGAPEGGYGSGASRM